VNFGDVNPGDIVYVLHSNNDAEKEIVKNVSSHNGFIYVDFSTTDLKIKVDAKKSIYFDEENDVVVFTKKHKLFN